MLVALASLVLLPAGGGVAALVHESNVALKDLKEGEIDMLAKGDEGTTEMRILGSEGRNAFRFTILKDGKPTFDCGGTKEKAIVVDHENRRVTPAFDLSKAPANTATVKESDIAPGNVSITIDPGEGFVIKANPAVENVRRWRSGGDELITGDFGTGENKRGSFQWVRDAKTKFPKSVNGIMDENKIDVQFTIRARKIGWSELLIPAEDYKGYALTTTP